MPVNNLNAHPYIWQGYLFAHNGRIENWLNVKTMWIERYRAELDILRKSVDKETKIKDLEARLNYFENATTDSMVLGPHIEARDFSTLVGCMAVVWMRCNRVFTYRCAKEAVAANIIWRYKKPVDGEPEDDQALTVVASTPEIIMDSIGKLSGIEFDYSFSDIREGTVYEVTPTGIESNGSVPSPVGHEDKFTSAVVENLDGDGPVEAE
jgi:hypothetical protein